MIVGPSSSCRSNFYIAVVGSWYQQPLCMCKCVIDWLHIYLNILMCEHTNDIFNTSGTDSEDAEKQMHNNNNKNYNENAEEEK